MSGLQMKYFVLKPNGPGPYAKASRMAMREYSEAIKSENPYLAKELRDWADQAHAETTLHPPASHPLLASLRKPR